MGLKKNVTYQNSQEIFRKFIPGYQPERLEPSDEPPNYELNSRSGSAVGRGLALEFRHALAAVKA